MINISTFAIDTLYIDEIDAATRVSTTSIDTLYRDNINSEVQISNIALDFAFNKEVDKKVRISNVIADIVYSKEIDRKIRISNFTLDIAYSLYDETSIDPSLIVYDLNFSSNIFNLSFSSLKAIVQPITRNQLPFRRYADSINLIPLSVTVPSLGRYGVVDTGPVSWYENSEFTDNLENDYYSAGKRKIKGGFLNLDLIEDAVKDVNSFSMTLSFANLYLTRELPVSAYSLSLDFKSLNFLETGFTLSPFYSSLSYNGINVYSTEIELVQFTPRMKFADLQYIGPPKLNVFNSKMYFKNIMFLPLSPIRVSLFAIDTLYNQAVEAKLRVSNIALDVGYEKVVDNKVRISNIALDVGYEKVVDNKVRVSNMAIDIAYLL